VVVTLLVLFASWIGRRGRFHCYRVRVTALLSRLDHKLTVTVAPLAIVPMLQSTKSGYAARCAAALRGRVPEPNPVVLRSVSVTVHLLPLRDRCSRPR